LSIESSGINDKKSHRHFTCGSNTWLQIVFTISLYPPLELPGVGVTELLGVAELTGVPELLELPDVPLKLPLLVPLALVELPFSRLSNDSNKLRDVL